MKLNCTFKPKIRELDPKVCPVGLDAQKAMIDKDQNKDKCLELFELSKLPKKRPQTEHKSEEEKEAKVEPEKKLEVEQKGAAKKAKVKLNARSIDSTINRLAKARKVEVIVEIL